VQVEVSGSGVTSGGGSFQLSARSVWVPPVCSYALLGSGRAYAEAWDRGLGEGILRSLPAAERNVALPLFQDHKDDDAGAWWYPACHPDRWVGSIADLLVLQAAWDAANDPVFVPAGTAVPVVAVVPPEVLAKAAYESMDLPKGLIRWNPSLQGTGATVVNMETWVWIEGGPTQVSVTARVGDMWARVDAVLGGLKLTAPGAHPASCPDSGVPWTAQTNGTTCSLVFYRSSANQPVKPGLSVPTATLTATASWAASWVSSVNPTPTVLPAQDVTTTADVPVAEIQSLVTSSS
jgi:hypothetical protein